MNLVSTYSQSGVNIYTAPLLVGTYQETDVDASQVFVDVEASGVVGAAANYSVYATIREGISGTHRDLLPHFVVPVSLTSFHLQIGPITLSQYSEIKVYLQGASGDTSVDVSAKMFRFLPLTTAEVSQVVANELGNAEVTADVNQLAIDLSPSALAAAVGSKVVAIDGTNSIQSVLAGLSNILLDFSTANVSGTGDVPNATESRQKGSSSSTSQNATPQIQWNSGFNPKSAVFYIALDEPIPAGAVISSASIAVWATAATGEECLLKVQLSAAPQTFAASSSMNGRSFSAGFQVYLYADMNYFDLTSELQAIQAADPTSAIAGIVLWISTATNSANETLSPFEVGNELALTVEYSATTAAMDAAVAEQLAHLDMDVSLAGGGIDAEGVRQAIGMAAADLDEQLAAIIEDTGTTLPALVSGLSGAIVSVVSSVDGGTITVYVGDTWRFTLLSEELTLDEYEVLGLVVKRSEKQADDDALLYLRTDDGLVRIGGAAPVDAANGELTKTANSFSTLVHLAETQELVAGSYLWWLKAFDTSVDPSEAKTLATGGFALKRAGLGAVA